MNGLSFLFFLVTYWVDKMGILKFYRRPPHREDALQRQVIHENLPPYERVIFQTDYLCPVLFCSFFVSRDVSLFPCTFLPLQVSVFLCMEMRVRRMSFPFRMVFFYLVITGWILTSGYYVEFPRIQSINQERELSCLKQGGLYR